MANIKARVGWVQVRVGGNSQESAELVSSLPNGTILAKDMSNAFNPTDTPPLAYTPDLLDLMGNISALTSTRWYLGEHQHLFPLLHSSTTMLGIPFFNSTPFDLGIVDYGLQILGDNLIAFQAGNEPDLYAHPPRTHRPTVGTRMRLSIQLSNSACQGYGPLNYMGDIGLLVNQVAVDPVITRKNGLFIIPSISATVWTPEDVWNTGIVSTYTDSLYGLAVERYVSIDCSLRR